MLNISETVEASANKCNVIQRFEYLQANGTQLLMLYSTTLAFIFKVKHLIVLHLRYKLWCIDSGHLRQNCLDSHSLAVELLLFITRCNSSLREVANESEARVYPVSQSFDGTSVHLEVRLDRTDAIDVTMLH